MGLGSMSINGSVTQTYIYEVRLNIDMIYIKSELVGEIDYTMTAEETIIMEVYGVII